MTRTVGVVFALVLITGPFAAHAATLEGLRAQLESLRAQLTGMQSISPAILSPLPVVQDPAQPAASCKVWYDGCNTCSRETPGGPMACTMMACFQNAGAYCKEHFTNISSPRICVLPYLSPLSRGTYNDRVRALQEFLAEEGYLSSSATGYFGSLTEAALRSYQLNQGIVGAGTGITGGWGIAGPRTWAHMLQQRCGVPQPLACTKEYAPVCGQPQGCENTCPPGMYCAAVCKMPEPRTYGNLCTLKAEGAQYLYGGPCSGGNTNAPPTIHSFSGPPTLSVNESGTWSLSASDPENGTLTYSIRWGDESTVPYAASREAAVSAVVQGTTFTHTYTRAGTYAISITVNDAGGLSSTASATVVVRGAYPVACTMEYAPVCGQSTHECCRANAPAYCAYTTVMCTASLKTYSNLCMLNADTATFLYTGTCSGGY